MIGICVAMPAAMLAWFRLKRYVDGAEREPPLTGTRSAVLEEPGASPAGSR